MRSFPLGRTVALAATLGLGCARHEMVPDYMTPECQNRVKPRSAMTVDSLRGGTLGPGTIAGQVGSTHASGGVTGALVVIDAVPLRHQTTDQSGQFAFVDLPAGVYRVSARRIGYEPIQDSVRVTSDRGIYLAVTLLAQVYDGPCSGFAAVPVRKPWWKVW